MQIKKEGVIQEFDPSTGEAWRLLRKRAHLTQVQLAEISGIVQPCISRLECKLRCAPRRETQQRLLAACGWREVAHE
jgi:predicted transcriptional regulator